MTILQETESIINSRPLTYLNEDSFKESLTPNHIIHFWNISNHYDEGIQSKNVTVKDVRNVCKHTGIVFKHFIQRFKNEYLLALLEKYSYVKRNIKQPSKLSVGDVVIIKDENVIRLSWLKGRITKLIESPDNNIRAVELNVYQPNSDRLCTIRRPIQHLVLLEIQNEIQEIEQPDKENEKEPAKQERLRRAAALNPDILQKICHESN